MNTCVNYYDLFEAQRNEAKVTQLVKSRALDLEPGLLVLTPSPSS